MHKKQHHPDYARIAQLERELGIVQPAYEPPPEPPPWPRSRPAAPPAAPVIKKPDQVCAQCIAGRPPAHGCIFYPVCQT